MKGSLIIAGHYFQRMARKPLLILFLLAIPFTLLLAEFAAFGRPVPATEAAPVPVRILRTSHTAEADRFVSCFVAQGGQSIRIQEVETATSRTSGGDLLRISGASPINVSLESGGGSQSDFILASSLASLCATQTTATSLPIAVSRPPAAPKKEESPGRFFASFFPGLALFGALFLSQSMASLIWRDHEQTVYRRLLTMPLSPSTLVVGPFLFLTTGAAASLLLILGVCALVANPWALAAPAFWAIAVGFALCAAGLQSVTGLFTRSQRAAQAMSASTNMMLAFFGGGFVPLALYPPLLRAAAYLLPNGAAQAGITQLLLSSGNPSHLVWRVATVWAWAAVLALLAVYLQSRRVGS